MKINRKVEQVLNKQVNLEFWSGYLYLSMSAWCDNIGLKGFANWMHIQHQEEMAHALKIFNFILTRAGKVELEPIAAVPVSWDGFLPMFEDVYDHECKITASINSCYEVAVAEKDHSTASMLQWFIDEQTEEEDNALNVIEQIKLVGNEGEGMYHIDKQLATRVFIDPTLTAAG
jgi:ferritin